MSWMVVCVLSDICGLEIFTDDNIGYAGSEQIAIALEQNSTLTFLNLDCMFFSY